ncbi:MAG: phage virion morphogenesis protein [Bacteroidetes bacterium]|nr:phage virion morphogenesis protein [Bacteroidota bacterium]
MNELNNYFAILDRVSKSVAKLPRRAATEAVNFSKQRFKSQNWVDTNTEPWKKRKPVKESRKRSGRAILTDTARLRRSIRVVHVDSNSVIIGTDVPYAEVHNNGFRGRVKQNVRSHTRRGNAVKAHTRTIKQNIPQRKFIGQSSVLNKKLERMMTAEIIRAIKG